MHRAIVVKTRATRPVMQTTQGDPFAHDRFYFNPRLFRFGYEYGITDELGHPLMMVRKRLFTLPLWVDIVADEAGTQRLLTIKQDSPWQVFTNTYTVYDDTGRPIAAVCREPLWASALWGYRLGQARLVVKDVDLNVVAAAEPEMDLLGMNWMINAPSGGMLGRWVRRLALTDKHTLDLTVDITRTFDRRLAVALGVLVDFTCRARRRLLS